MQIDIVKVGELETNCYILSKDNKCLIIDPGAEADLILNIIKDKTLEGILITHYHYDHVGALDEVKEKTNAKVYDYSNLEEKEHNISNFKFEVIHTPGHKEDAITIYFKEEKVMFTGDFLFKGTIGRTDFPGSNHENMLKSLLKLNNYNKDIKIYPGHGETTTLDYEFKYNYFLRS